MFLEMACCIPEHHLPHADGSQRNALGTLLCLRYWPWSTPSVWKYFGKQNAWPVAVNGDCFGCSLSTPYAGSGRAGLLCNQHLQQAPWPIKMPIKSQSSTTRVYSSHQEHLNERDAEIFHVALGVLPSLQGGLCFGAPSSSQAFPQLPTPLDIKTTLYT